MPSKEDYDAIEPITKAIVSKDKLDHEKLANLTDDYVNGHPRKAVLLMVMICTNIAERIMLEIERPEDARVSLLHSAFDKKSGREREGDGSTEFVMHLVEHAVNAEVEELYDHLLDLTDDHETFLSVIGSSYVLYRKIMALGMGGDARLTSILVDEDGMEVLKDVGNTEIGNDR